VFSAVSTTRQAAGASEAEALAAGLSSACLLLAISAVAGIALALLMGRHRPTKQRLIGAAAAAAATSHTIPTELPHIPTPRGNPLQSDGDT